MADKSAVTKEQDTSRARAIGPSDPADHLTEIADAFNAAVARCVRDADPDAVHRLRTGSRRLQAMLEARLRESTTFYLNQPARAWLKQLKQVRQAAGAVRDLDVQRKLLERWLGKQAAPGSDAEAVDKQAEMLDGWLKSERKHLARGMQKQIKKRQRGIGRVSGLQCSPLRHRRPRQGEGCAFRRCRGPGRICACRRRNVRCWMRRTCMNFARQPRRRAI